MTPTVLMLRLKTTCGRGLKATPTHRYLKAAGPVLVLFPLKPELDGFSESKSLCLGVGGGASTNRLRVSGSESTALDPLEVSPKFWLETNGPVHLNGSMSDVSICYRSPEAAAVREPGRRLQRPADDSLFQRRRVSFLKCSSCSLMTDRIKKKTQPDFNMSLIDTRGDEKKKRQKSISIFINRRRWSEINRGGLKASIQRKITRYESR